MKYVEYVVNSLNVEVKLLCKLVFKLLGIILDEIIYICCDVNYDDKCVGLVVWLYIFLLVKMWINGLIIFNKLLLQFYIQYNVVLLWDSIDMDFMNLNQIVYGGCEFGFIGVCMCQ